MINSPVQKIKERLSIEEVVSTYIKLEKAGANLKAKCPFHNEKTPSFFVSPVRGSYYCFGCGASGDIFTFVEEFEGLDFKGALRLLADKAGVVLGEFNREAESEKERLYKAMEESTKYFSSNLNTSKEALEYLKSRGLNEQSIKDFRIGFVPADWRLLYVNLKSKNFTDIEIEKAGLAKKTDKGYYDRFRGRIMFPISDSSGRIVAFSGRILQDDPSSRAGLTTGQAVSQAKYLNSPETPIFNKSSVLFGLDKAKDSIRKNNFSILVEGQMDLVLSHQAGYKNTVATSGTALSDSTVSKENVVSNLGLVRRLSENIVLAFDGDKAGFNASIRAGRIALSLGMDVKVAKMPEGVDPADLISKFGTDVWKGAIRDSKHIIEFLLDKVLKDSGADARKTGREIKEKVLPFVSAVESSIEKAHFLKKISDLSGIPEDALRDDLGKIEQELKFEKKEIKEADEALSKVHRKDNILRKLLGIALWQKTLKEQSIDVETMLKKLSEALSISIEDVLKKTSGKEEDFIFEAEVFYGGDSDIEKDTKEMLLNLRKEYLKEELGVKMKELRQAEWMKDSAQSKSILIKISEINNKIQEIEHEKEKQKTK